MTIPAQCFRKPPPGGSVCDRQAEVRVHLLEVSSGLTVSREPMCPVHAYDMVRRAFRDVDRPPGELMTVILAPLD